MNLNDKIVVKQPENVVIIGLIGTIITNMRETDKGTVTDISYEVLDIDSKDQLIASVHESNVMTLDDYIAELQAL